MANLEALVEAEKRGILPPDKAPLLAEARKRGLVPAAVVAEKEEAPGRFASELARRKAEADANPGAWNAAKRTFSDLNDTRQALLKMITGIPGSIAGDLAGLGTVTLGASAQLAQKSGLIDQSTVDKIDPSAVQAKVASALTYDPDNPESLPNQITETPGRLIAGAGDKLATSTGADQIPYLDGAVRAIPRAIAELVGVKAGKGALKPTAAAADVAEAAPAARSTVAPEMPPAASTPDMPLAAPPPALPAPANTAVGRAVPPQPQMKGLPGPEEIPQAPPLAPLDTPPPAPATTPKPPLVKNKNASVADLDKQAIETLRGADIKLTREQRDPGIVGKLAGSTDRASNALVGRGKFAREQMQDFTRAVFKKVGIDAKNATAESMAELKQKVSNDYDAAHAGVNVKMDGEFIVDLKEIQAKAHRNADVETRLDKMFDHIGRNAKADGTITAEAAESIRSELGKMQGSPNGAIADFAREMKDALDAATTRSAPAARVKQLLEARKQFHFMRQIESAIDTKNGLISPRKLLAAINRKRNKNEAFYGAGDQSLVKLANAGAKVLPEMIADSGSATRISDIFKLTEPVTALKAAGAALGGRLFNESGARRGTPSWLAEQEAKRQQGTSPLNAAGRQAATETEEEKRRRLQAEAMRR